MNTQFESRNRPLTRAYDRLAGQALPVSSPSALFRLLILGAVVTAILISMPALAQTAPSLGTASNFGVLGGSTVTNTGGTTVTGDLGVSPGSAITGFPPGVVIGSIHTANATAQQAQSDALTAYNALAGQSCLTNLTGQDLGGLTLTPGVYCFSSSAQLTGTLTLDALGDPAAVFIFQIETTLITSSGASVQVINGGQNCNVFFAVGSSATLGSTTSFAGNILAVSSITLNTGASMSGRALARTGAVTLDTNSVNASLAACGTPPPPGPFPPAPQSIICPPGGLISGGSAGVGSVTLSSPAPAGGVLVTLTASPPGRVSIPSSIVIPAGTTSASFTVTPLAGSGFVTITATTAGGTVACSFTVVGTTAVPALDYAGLAIMLMLLAGTALFAMNKFN